VSRPRGCFRSAQDRAADDQFTPGAPCNHQGGSRAGARRVPVGVELAGHQVQVPDVLVRLGRLAEARGEFERAADLCDNERERELLLSRAVACGA